MAAITAKKTLIISEDWCKGCGICVSTCPKDVLEMKEEVVAIKDLEKCIYCELCEMRCPDFAIYIKEDEEDDS